MLSQYKKNMNESRSKQMLDNKVVNRGNQKGFSNDDMASLFSLHAEQHGNGPLDQQNNFGSRKDVNAHRMQNMNAKIGYFEKEI